MAKPERISEEEKFVSRGSNFSVRETKDLVGKRVIISNFLKEKDCVMVIPVLESGEILLEKQYRAAAFSYGKKTNDGYLYELPGGHMESDEDTKKTAARELEEETGYAPRKVSILYKRSMAPYLTTAEEYVCLAERLRKTNKNLDHDEVISTVKMTKREIIKNLKSGRIRDTLTREALLYYLYFVK